MSEKKPKDAIRVWVPGCSSGEEPYSIGMILLEQIELMKKDCPIQIFASDIDEEALAVARTGIYPQSLRTYSKVNSGERMSRYSGLCLYLLICQKGSLLMRYVFQKWRCYNNLVLDFRNRSFQTILFWALCQNTQFVARKCPQGLADCEGSGHDA